MRDRLYGIGLWFELAEHNRVVRTQLYDSKYDFTSSPECGITAISLLTDVLSGSKRELMLNRCTLWSAVAQR